MELLGYNIDPFVDPQPVDAIILYFEGFYGVKPVYNLSKSMIGGIDDHLLEEYRRSTGEGYFEGIFSAALFLFYGTFLLFILVLFLIIDYIPSGNVKGNRLPLLGGITNCSNSGLLLDRMVYIKGLSNKSISSEALESLGTLRSGFSFMDFFSFVLGLVWYDCVIDGNSG